jgi:hypothetical protein
MNPPANAVIPPFARRVSSSRQQSEYLFQSGFTAARWWQKRAREAALFSWTPAARCCRQSASAPARPPRRPRRLIWRDRQPAGASAAPCRLQLPPPSARSAAAPRCSLRARSRCPDGCAETLKLARGFTVALLAGLVRDRFATAGLNSANVVWVEITDLGREMLASMSRPPRRAPG